MLKSRSPGGCLAEILILFHFLLCEYQSQLLEFQLIFPEKNGQFPALILALQDPLCGRRVGVQSNLKSLSTNEYIVS